MDTHGQEQIQSHLDSNKFKDLLYLFAWVVEIIVVIAGLFISIIVGLDAFEKTTRFNDPTTTTYLNSFIAFIPFFLVSVVELTKIPVAGAIFYTSSAIWKVLLSVMLLSLVIITFETSLNGFQRNYSQRTVVIEKRREQLVPIELEILRIKEEKKTLQETTLETIENNFNTRNSVLQKSQEDELGPLWDEISRLRSLGHDSRVKAVDKNIERFEGIISRGDDDFQSEVNLLNSEHGENKKYIHQESNRKRIEIERTIEALKVDLRDLKKDKQDASKSSVVSGFLNTFNLKDSEIDEKLADIKLYTSNLHAMPSINNAITIENDRYSGALAVAEKKLSNLKQSALLKIEELNNQKSELLSTTHKSNKSRIDGLNEQIESISKRFGSQREKSIAERQREISRLKIKTDRIDNIDEKINDLEKDQNKLKSAINMAANDDQIYQIAKMIFPDAKTAADVSSTQAGTVAIIWFGSLAFIVAVTGILLAFASFVISKEKYYQSKQHASKGCVTKLAHSVRYLLISRRKSMLTSRYKEVIIEKEIPVEVIREVPVEVIKEIPVDKVVLKEVPVEVIMKEVTHVPLYTNDPDLLKFGTVRIKDIKEDG